MTRPAVGAGLLSPPAPSGPQQRSARQPQSHGSDGYDPAARLARAAANEYDKLTASPPHFPTLQKVVALAALSIPALASDSDQEDIRRYASPAAAQRPTAAQKREAHPNSDDLGRNVSHSRIWQGLAAVAGP